MRSFLQDLRVGFRSLFRNPSFTAAALLTLVVGFGASVIILSWTRAVLFHPLPYVDADRIVILWRQTEQMERSSLSYLNFLDWKDRNRVFSEVALARSDRWNLAGEPEPERIEGLTVSAELLTTLGIEPHRGRGFAPSDDRLGADRTVMISYEFWQRRFAGDESWIGRTVMLDDRSYTVIGILPPGLSSERLGDAPLGDVWLPIGLLLDELPVHERADRIGIVPVARLEPGVTLDSAAQDMDRVAAELEADYPLINRGNRARMAPVLEDLVGDLRPAVRILQAAVAFVLLIACANLISLLLSRFLSRGEELAVRTALGASRARLVRQGMAEAFGLALLGSLGGLATAALALRLVPRVLPGVRYVDRAEIDLFVLVGVGALCLGVTLVIGLVPILRVVAKPETLALRGARSLSTRQRLRQSLVIAELAMALALMIGAALALDTYRNLSRVRLGFSTDKILTASISLPMPKYAEASDWMGFFDQVLERLRGLPGVDAAAVTSTIPLGQGGAGSRVLAGDRPIPALPDMATTRYVTASADYFETLGIPLLEGRPWSFEHDDRLNSDDGHGPSRVVVINQTLARHFWPERTAIGQRLAFELDGTPADFEPIWREVIGVVGDVPYVDPRDAPENTVYVSHTQYPLWNRDIHPLMSVMVRTLSEPQGLTAALRVQVREVDSDQPIHDVRTLEEIAAGHLDHSRMVSGLLASFALLALSLALIGIYGVVSYMLTSRQRELGIRIALGARPVQLLSSLLTRNLALIAIGVGAGLVLAWGLTRILASELYGVDALDPGIFAIAVMLLASVAFVATLIPAVRALRIDTIRSLNPE